MRNKNVGVGVANTNSIVKDVTKSIIVVMINDELEYDWIIRYRLHNISDTLYGAKVVKLTEDKDKEIRKLELEIRRLQMVIRLQEDIIDSYRELSRLKGSKLVVE